MKLDINKLVGTNTPPVSPALIARNQLKQRQQLQRQVVKDADQTTLEELGKGQLLDYQGNLAGEIETIIYNNADVRKVYFSLKPVLKPTATPLIFNMLYKNVDLIKKIRWVRDKADKRADRLFSR